MTGTIFDIKRFAVGDGPGVRTTVFFKGCPLRCRWCHNPEGLSREPELMHIRAKCRDCGLCRRPCDHPDCAPWGRCLHVCPENCLKVAGRTVTADALAAELMADAPVLAAMGGGITCSGGEPLWQGDFLCALLDRLSGVHRCIETSGYGDEATFAAVLDRLDCVLFDLKLAADDAHRAFTGVSNAPIHRNLAALRASGKPFTLRVPLIPGITDTDENLRGLAQIAGDDPVELLPYNPLAGAKYPQLGCDYPLGDTISDLPRSDATRFFARAVLRK